MIFLSERMFLSAKAVYVAIPLFSQRFLNAALNSVPLSDQPFCGCTFSINFLNALAASGALFDHIDTTRKNLDTTSTAISKFSIVIFYQLVHIGDIY